MALAEDQFSALERHSAPMGDVDQVLRAHPKAYVDWIKSSVPETGSAQLDPDTHASPGSWEAAMRAQGASCDAVDKVMTGAAQNAFCSIRPPGHHAEKEKAMGFCLFNSAAIAARHAQAKHGAERVAIIDFDVHHGNGSQDIFWSDDSVFYASTHQLPLFPGSGELSETGAGNIVNAPMSPGTDGAGFQDAVSSRVLPALEHFSPDLVIISAGFDAHQRDPLAHINLLEDDYRWVTGKLMDIAEAKCGGRVVSLLEGGYDLVGLSRSVAAHVETLMGR